MYRERKRYNSVDSTLRRKSSMITKVLLIGLIFIVYSVSIAPIIHNKTESAMVEIGSSKISTSGYTLEPLLLSQSESYQSNLYSLSLTEYSFENQLNKNSLFVTTDPRVIAMRQFLIDRNSPMYPYAEVFVTEADKYGLDWRLVASISGVESAFGVLIPKGSHNGWGWKGDPNRPWSLFPSWTAAIEVVTARLALGYGTHLTPFEIEPTYCPPCGRTEGHPWANGVTRFMNELQYYHDSI